MIRRRHRKTRWVRVVTVCWVVVVITAARLTVQRTSGSPESSANASALKEAFAPFALPVALFETKVPENRGHGILTEASTEVRVWHAQE